MSKPDLLPHSSAQPRICPACEISLQMAAKDGKRANHVHFCLYSHWQPDVKNGDQAGVLAVASARGGVIVSYQLVGPIAAREALALAKQYTNWAEEAGIPIRNETAN